MEQLLSDIKILDLTHYIAGPYCTKLLADRGADVIKIEEPGKGDGARRLGPFFGNEPHPEKSGLFLHLNTNKRGITLNLKSVTGKKIFKKLLRGVDILVENFSPRVMPGLGLGYDTLEEVNPKLVMTSISNFGQTGPYRDFKASEIIISGMGHTMNTQGDSEREPVKMAGNLMQYQSGVIAAALTMIGLFSSRLQGIGQHIDVSIMETHLGSIDRRAMNLVGHAYNPTEVSGRATYGIGYGFPSGNWPCKNGYFSIVGGARMGFWPRVVAMLEMPELLEDSRFCTPEAQARVENSEAFTQIFLPWCMEHTVEEITTLGQQKRVLVAPVNNAQQLVNDCHMKARDSFVDIDHPITRRADTHRQARGYLLTGEIKYPGIPFRTSKPSPMICLAPMLGQHNVDIYGQLGYDRGNIIKLRETGVI
ncbi:CaiB/BaiF CoA transferase family protein [Chloroflexota bacterium]